MNHYGWLDLNFEQFLQSLGIGSTFLHDSGIGGVSDYRGMIVTHGDKCYSHANEWKRAGIPFEHGVALYLLTYIRPYSRQVRQTDKGWVDPCAWVINNYREFAKHLQATSLRTPMELKRLVFIGNGAKELPGHRLAKWTIHVDINSNPEHVPVFVLNIRCDGYSGDNWVCWDGLYRVEDPLMHILPVGESHREDAEKWNPQKLMTETEWAEITRLVKCDIAGWLSGNKSR